MVVCSTCAVEGAFYDHSLVQQKPVLKGYLVVCEMRVAKTSPCKGNTFFSSKLKLEAEDIFRTVATHLLLYTLISYILAVQILHKMWF